MYGTDHQRQTDGMSNTVALSRGSYATTRLVELAILLYAATIPLSGISKRPTTSASWHWIQ